MPTGAYGRRGIGTEASVARGAMTVIGLPRAQEMLGGLATRLGDPIPVLTATMSALEDAEVILFDHLAPAFNRTGATRASLTQPDARGAIRRIHGFEAEFGTSIWYAKFLRKIGGPSGKPKGRKREGPNLVLQTRREDRRAAVKALAQYLLGR